MKITVICLCLILTLACRQRVYEPEEKVRDNQHIETLVQVNRYLVKQDEQTIRQFVDSVGWTMELTESGLWYQFISRGKGMSVKLGDRVSLDYELRLLDGTLCYESGSLGPKIFKVGMGGVEPGLEEGILLLREGDVARFVLPPHLAHGLVGDDKNIPPRAIIRYEIKLLEVISADEEK